jgi:2-aminoethylphosphonate dioxygenase
LRWTAELESAPEASGTHWVYHEDSLTRPKRRLLQRIENFCPYHESFDRFVRKGQLASWTAALMGGITDRGPLGAQLLGEQWKPLDVANLNLRPVPTGPGDVIFFDSFVPHASKPNFTALPRRVLYLTYNLASEGDQRGRYFADKHASFPPDIDRDPEKVYVFRV